MRRILLYNTGGFTFTLRRRPRLNATGAMTPVSCHQIHKPHEIVGAEVRPPCGHYRERVRGNCVGPGGRQSHEATLLIMEVNPMLAPRLPVGHEFELATAEWVEGMGDLEPSWRMLPIRCS